MAKHFDHCLKLAFFGLGFVRSAVGRSNKTYTKKSQLQTMVKMFSQSGNIGLENKIGKHFLKTGIVSLLNIPWNMPGGGAHISLLESITELLLFL